LGNLFVVYGKTNLKTWKREIERHDLTKEFQLGFRVKYKPGF